MCRSRLFARNVGFAFFLTLLLFVIRSCPAQASPAIGIGRHLVPSQVSPSASAFKLAIGNSRCSITAIGTRNGKSLLVSCNHCFAHQRFQGAEFPRADYPVKCIVLSRDGKERYEATAIDGSSSPDLALVIVDAVLPCVQLADTLPTRGDDCEHFGITSGYSSGKVLFARDVGKGPPNNSWGSTCTSIPGDSGAGVFVGGKLAAVNWGYYSGVNQAGTSVSYVRAMCRQSAQAREILGLEPPKDESVPLGPMGNPPSVPYSPDEDGLRPILPLRPIRPVIFPRLRSMFDRW